MAYLLVTHTHPCGFSAFRRHAARVSSESSQYGSPLMSFVLGADLDFVPIRIPPSSTTSYVTSKKKFDNSQSLTKRKRKGERKGRGHFLIAACGAGGRPSWARARAPVAVTKGLWTLAVTAHRAHAPEAVTAHGVRRKP